MYCDHEYDEAKLYGGINIQYHVIDGKIEPMMLWHRHIVNSVCPRIVPLVHELASSQIVLSASSLVRESSICKLACPRKVQLPIQSVPY